MAQTTWRMKLAAAMQEAHESFDDVVATTLSNEDMDVTFCDGFGGSEGKPFTLWTKNRVYFPVVYDGAEWVESVPRDPCDYATPHVGGE